MPSPHTTPAPTPAAAPSRSVPHPAGSSLRTRAAASPAQLVAAALDGDVAAAGELYGRYFERARHVVLSYCAANDAEDAVAEGFVKALERLDRLRNPAAVEAWMIRCAVRAAIDLNRRQRRLRPGLLNAAALESAGPVAEPADDGALRSMERRSLALALGRLPEPTRTLLWLRFAEDRSVSQIAAQLGLPEGTVRRRCFEAYRDAGGRFLAAGLRPPRARCQQVVDELCRARSRPLSVSVQRRVAAHLGWCAACRARQDELNVTVPVPASPSGSGRTKSDKSAQCSELPSDNTSRRAERNSTNGRRS